MKRYLAQAAPLKVPLAPFLAVLEVSPLLAGLCLQSQIDSIAFDPLLTRKLSTNSRVQRHWE